MAYRVFIGNLPMNIREREIDDLFGKYGRIRDIDLKTPSRPPAYAFITFDDVRDAEDAIRGRDGYDFDGDRLRVEFAKGIILLSLFPETCLGLSKCFNSLGDLRFRF